MEKFWCFFSISSVIWNKSTLICNVIDDNDTTKISNGSWELVRTKFNLFETDQHTKCMKYGHELVWFSSEPIPIYTLILIPVSSRTMCTVRTLYIYTCYSAMAMASTRLVDEMARTWKSTETMFVHIQIDGLYSNQV